MGSTRAPLTPDEVDRLFSGGGNFITADAIRPDRAETNTLRYGKCAWCRVSQPCLYGFLRDDDWAEVVPLDSNLRAVVRQLRIDTGRRIIDLCDGCIADLTALDVPATPPTGQLALFDN